MPARVDLSRFNNDHYETGRSFLVRTAWFLFGLPMLRCSALPSSSLRRTLLRLFGAEIGKGAVIKPGFRVKFPWKLRAGSHCWFGEDSWIDNLAPVTLGNHVCISQGVYLCTGNHDWSDPTFGLITKPIYVEDGAWIAAKATVGPGVTIGQCAVAGFGAVVTASIPPYEIHNGNPATFLRRREIHLNYDICNNDIYRESGNPNTSKAEAPARAEQAESEFPRIRGA
jgi:putative colanic acid biosynthesis acetyltransferase WcaF